MSLRRARASARTSVRRAPRGAPACRRCTRSAAHAARRGARRRGPQLASWTTLSARPSPRSLGRASLRASQSHRHGWCPRRSASLPTSPGASVERSRSTRRSRTTDLLAGQRAARDVRSAAKHRLMPRPPGRRTATWPDTDRSLSRSAIPAEGHGASTARSPPSRSAFRRNHIPRRALLWRLMCVECGPISPSAARGSFLAVRARESAKTAASYSLFASRARSSPRQRTLTAVRTICSRGTCG